MSIARCSYYCKYYYLYGELLASAPSGSSISGCNEVKPRHKELHIKKEYVYTMKHHTRSRERVREHSLTLILTCAKRKFKDINKTSRRLMKSRELAPFQAHSKQPSCHSGLFLHLRFCHCLSVSMEIMAHLLNFGLLILVHSHRKQ